MATSAERRRVCRIICARSALASPAAVASPARRECPEKRSRPSSPASWPRHVHQAPDRFVGQLSGAEAACLAQPNEQRQRRIRGAAAKVRSVPPEAHSGLHAASGQQKGSAGLAQKAASCPAPWGSVLERRMVTWSPFPTTATTSPSVRPTSSARRSAAPRRAAPRRSRAVAARGRGRRAVWWPPAGSPASCAADRGWRQQPAGAALCRCCG